MKALRESGDYQKGDERILGEGDFVTQILSEADERLARCYHMRARRYRLEDIVNRVTQLTGVSSEGILSSRKVPKRVVARGLLCYWAVKELDIRHGELAERLGVSQSAVSRATQRGEALVRERQYSFVEGNA